MSVASCSNLFLASLWSLPRMCHVVSKVATGVQVVDVETGFYLSLQKGCYNWQRAEDFKNIFSMSLQSWQLCHQSAGKPDRRARRASLSFEAVVEEGFMSDVLHSPGEARLLGYFLLRCMLSKLHLYQEISLHLMKICAVSDVQIMLSEMMAHRICSPFLFCFQFYKN